MPPVRRQINPYAPRLRRDRTIAENDFWQAARNRQIDGCKFRFQHSIGPYAADFACLDAMLIVEIDGDQHDETRDADRTHFLEDEGFEIIRFWNNDVLGNLEGVIAVVRERLASRMINAEERPSPNPLPQAGEG